MTPCQLRNLLAIPSAFLVLILIMWAPSVGQTKAGPEKPLDKEHAEKMAKGIDIFKKHVKPVLVQKCLRCHGGKDVEGEFDLGDRVELLRGGNKGPAIEVGKAKESLLYKLIRHESKPFMPHKGTKLPDETIAHVADWIDLGAPYDEPLIVRKKGLAWTERVIRDDARLFWSFQPIKRVEPPAVKETGWIKTPIDRFILAKLETTELKHNPPAEKRQLMRRAYFDLIGLPPTPEEVTAFLNDQAPDAYEKMLDRLLASPHHGERWARHWLDLARFAESHGYEQDYDRPGAYHYRDFVIKAFNDDLPYNTFVKWQMAGDEYEPSNPLAQMATGFLAAGVHSTQITANEVAKHRYDEMDDKLATTGTALLGLTFGCARCHDHKYDPILQRDYYRMLATFTTTVRTEVQVNLESEKYTQAKVAFDKGHAPFLAALAKFEAEVLPGRLAEWEKKRPATGAGQVSPWEVLDIAVSKSKDAATTFTPQPDGSLLVGGKNVPFDVYTFTANTSMTGITAVRLEALADPSMVKKGPGRAMNGNFALSDVRLSIAPKKGGKAVAVKLKNPRATFEQKGLPIAAAIDGNDKSAWAIDPKFGQDHAAIFDTDAPIGFPEGSILTFTLHFNNNDGHNIGRPRLALTTMASAGLTDPGMPHQPAVALRTPAQERSAEQKAVLLKWFGPQDPDWRKLHQQEQQHWQQAPKPNMVKAMIASEGLPAIRTHTQGGDFFNETYFMRRGDIDQKEGVASQSFLQVLMNAPEQEKHWQTPPPAGWRTSYRRRAMAEWLTDTEHGAGQLLARVIVNRLWQHHMGRGIVATPSDFGARGEPPSHPELLDYLASELIKNGWRLKPIHKLIMSSNVYRQSSAVDENKKRLDSHNQLFARWPARRLEAEAIRDNMLSVSGVLDPKMFGAGTLDEASKRRSVYFMIKRSKLIPMMQIFDAPDASGGIGERPTTTIAPQALLLMNNAHVRTWAKGFVRRIAPDAKTSVDEAVKAGYMIALARQPSLQELADSLAFVNQQMATYPAATGRELALADFCQVLMCLNEFIYVD